MKRLDLKALRERADEQMAAALATPGVSPFCSSALWQLAALEHLHPEADPSAVLIAEREGAWVLLSERGASGVLLPLEAAWAFGSPLVGPPEAATDLLLDLAHAERARRGRPLAIFLSGLSPQGALFGAVQALENYGRGLRPYPGTEVMLIDLSEGVDAWLSRRSRKFRRSLRAAETRAPEIELEDASRDDPERSFARLLAVQVQTYKWREHTDIFQMREYADFYRTLLFELHARGALRLLFARRDGEDLAHIFGAAFGSTYRGLQMSYREDCRQLGLGNRLQIENLRRSEAEGICEYDLGMHSPYKERWADQREDRPSWLWML